MDHDSIYRLYVEFCKRLGIKPGDEGRILPRHRKVLGGRMEYRTRNLKLAIFILARGADIPEIRGERGNAQFVFPDPEGNLGWEEQEYAADTAVSPHQLFWAQKELRAQMDRAFGRRP
jgi:hypothetical protein